MKQQKFYMVKKHLKKLNKQQKKPLIKKGIGSNLPEIKIKLKLILKNGIKIF